MNGNLERSVDVLKRWIDGAAVPRESSFHRFVTRSLSFLR